jgi:probable rRNA maturation factor
VPARSITLANHHPRLRLDRRAVTRVLRTLDAHFADAKKSAPAVPPGELSLVFLTDSALAQLHADFLADPTPTDVITFEGNPAFGTAGEICVSVDAALRHVAPAVPTLSARLSALSSAAFSTELTLYVVHGWLHLAGYDDLVPAKKRVMRRAETRAMNILRTHDCLPRFTLR